jgi:hypothetical protein
LTVKKWYLLWAVIGLFSCAGPEQHEQVPWVFQPITDMREVGGKWQGVLKRIPETVDDWVKVVISEDGAYQFATYRTIGVFKGSGKFSLKEGRLRAEGEKGNIGGELYLAGNRRLLKIQAHSHDGNNYVVSLTPAP